MNELLMAADRLEQQGNPLGRLLRFSRLVTWRPLNLVEVASISTNHHWGADNGEFMIEGADGCGCGDGPTGMDGDGRIRYDVDRTGGMVAAKGCDFF